MDAIYAVSLDGRTVTKLAVGLTGLEFMTAGTDGVFADGIFVATQGTDLNGDGGVYVLSADGTLSRLLLGIDATHVAFATEAVLGGGLFVADMANPSGAPHDPVSRIYRVVPR